MSNEKPPSGGDGEKLRNRGGEEEMGKVFDFQKFRERKEKQALPDPDERTVHISPPANDEIDPRLLPSAETVPMTAEIGLNKLLAEYEEKMKLAEPHMVRDFVREFISEASGIVIESRRLAPGGNVLGGWNETDKVLAKLKRDTVSYLDGNIDSSASENMTPYYRSIGLTAMHRVVKAMKYDLAEADRLRKKDDEKPEY